LQFFEHRRMSTGAHNNMHFQKAYSGNAANRSAVMMRSHSGSFLS
jgi:hypothetical protein